MPVSLLACVVVFCVAAFAVGQPTTRPASIKALTYNIRWANPLDGQDAWPKRQDAFVDNVKTIDADLIGFQEVIASQYDDLVKALPDYASLSAGRDDGHRAGEASPVFWRAARFDKKDGGTFWLSDTPDAVGVKGWDASLPRICTWVTLLDKQTGREICLVNTHFDHMGVKAREQSAELLARRIPVLAKGRPVVLVGDFNSIETSPGYYALTQLLADAYRTIHPARDDNERTAHAFEGETMGYRIDWVLHSPEFAPVAAEIDRTKTPAGRYPSDHFAVWATLRYVDAAK